MDKYRTVSIKSFAGELGRLAKGIQDIPGRDTIQLICRSAIPKGRTFTYGRIVVNYCSQKKYPNFTILTVGGNHIHYPWDVRNTTSDLSTSNILFKYVISTPSAIFITMDIKNLYLGNPMKRL